MRRGWVNKAVGWVSRSTSAMGIVGEERRGDKGEGVWCSYTNGDGNEGLLDGGVKTGRKAEG